MRLDFAMAITLLATASAFGGDDAPARPLGPSYDAPSVRFLDIIFYYEDWESSLAGARMERPPHLPRIPDQRPDIVPDGLTGSLVAACAVLEWPVIAGGVDLSQSEAELAASILGTNVQDALRRGRMRLDEVRPGHPVVALTFDGSNATDASFDRLDGLPCLESLSFNYAVGGIDGSTFSPVTDIGLSRLKRLKSLRSLSLPYLPHATDAGMSMLSELKQLRELSIGGPHLGNLTASRISTLEGLVSLEIGTSLGMGEMGELTDKGLGKLASLRRLETLTIRAPKLTDEGLGVLKALPQLRSLVLSLGSAYGPGKDYGPWRNERGLGERCLVHLRHLPKLRSLTIYGNGSDFTHDHSLSFLDGLPELESLAISSQGVSDAGLVAIGRLSKLKRLSLGYYPLNSAPITERGLKHLSSLTRLEDVEFNYTKVTKAGIDDLRRMFPKARIVAR